MCFCSCELIRTWSMMLQWTVQVLYLSIIIRQHDLQHFTVYRTKWAHLPLILQHFLSDVYLSRQEIWHNFKKWFCLMLTHLWYRVCLKQRIQPNIWHWGASILRMYLSWQGMAVCDTPSGAHWSGRGPLADPNSLPPIPAGVWCATVGSPSLFLLVASLPWWSGLISCNCGRHLNGS